MEEFTEGKQGRNAEEQARFEARSRYNKKLDEGYGVDEPEDGVIRNTLGFPAPQKAKPLPKNFEYQKDQTYWFQPKLDGHRAMIVLSRTGASMYSRNGKEITTMNHILMWVVGQLQTYDVLGDLKHIYLDGELYLHGTSLQNIGRLVKKHRPGESDKVQFHMYDLVREDRFGETYVERLECIRKLQDRWGLPSTLLWENEEVGAFPLYSVNTAQADTMEDAMGSANDMRGEGYEGGILRRGSAPYMPGFRNDGLLKLKEFDDHEFEIVEVIRGRPRIVPGEPTLEVACFICKMDDGKIFEVTAPGTMYEKDAAWTNRASYPGKMLTVQHSDYTDEGLPWHPVALRLREDI